MPVGQNESYTCVASSEPTWKIERNGSVVPATTGCDAGICISKEQLKGGNYSSTLTIDGIPSNNNTVINCRTKQVFSDDKFTFNVFGKNSLCTLDS